MRIAFYAPLKSPNHPVPSGDRLMARLLLRAMRDAGHIVDVISELRAFVPDALSPRHAEVAAAAVTERERITKAWRTEGAPDLWFCYHPYYKAPDLLGPALSKQFSLPYVTAEASYSHRRNIAAWAEAQAMLLDSVSHAALNLCLTDRDRAGLVEVAPDARLAMLRPFIDTAPFLTVPRPSRGRLVTVAMMRPGDKLMSYSILAQALHLLSNEAWTLTIIGDGPARAEIEAMFACLPTDRLIWRGERSTAEIAAELAEASLYVWPGCGEAYGLAYLEAQAAGLPVIAQAVAGVPEVVVQGSTGLLSAPDDLAAFAANIRSLLNDDERRAAMARQARAFALEQRSLAQATRDLDAHLQAALKGNNR